MTSSARTNRLLAAGLKPEVPDTRPTRHEITQRAIRDNRDQAELPRRIRAIEARLDGQDHKPLLQRLQERLHDVTQRR